MTTRTRPDHEPVGDNTERGSATIFVTIMTFVILACLALVLDGSSKLSTASKVDATAREAARAGSQHLKGDAISGQAASIDPAAAVSAAQQYLAAACVSGTVSVQGNTLVVTTSKAWSPKLLGAFGVGSKTIRGRATVDMTRVTP